MNNGQALINFHFLLFSVREKEATPVCDVDGYPTLPQLHEH